MLVSYWEPLPDDGVAKLTSYLAADQGPNGYQILTPQIQLSPPLWRIPRIRCTPDLGARVI